MSALAELEADGWACSVDDQGICRVEINDAAYLVRRFELLAEKGGRQLHGTAEVDAELLKVRPDRAEKEQDFMWTAMLQKVKSA